MSTTTSPRRGAAGAPDVATVPPLLPLLAVGVTLLLWASAFVAIRHLGHDFSPGSLSLGRLVVASTGLGVLVLLTGRLRRPTRAEWLRLVAIGLLWYAFYNVALNAGELTVDAGTAAMLIQVSPTLVAVLAAMFLGERFTRWLGLGLALAFAGVVLISASGGSGSDRDVVGVLLVLGAAAAYAVSAILQKPLTRRLPAMQITWLACTVGTIACLPWAGRLAGEVAAAPTSQVLWVVYLGVFPTAIAFTTYAYALTHMSASSLGMTTYLVPPITILLGWLLLGEVPAPLAYAGGALCLLGVAVARRRSRPARPAGPVTAR